MPISTLLIANRGEIALRIIRTAREAGIRTVAVYSDADRGSPHVRAADMAVRIGPAPASESYLSIPAILSAASAVGADAIHPGYGFLSERAPFARAVADAGLTFVGPTAEVIGQMGRKDSAREIAVAAGVPVVPRGEDAGFPMMVKAAAGGGGKGMRIVRSAAELDGAMAAARREAKSAFGDDAVLLERYVEHGRHVEVQVLADHHGNVVHLFERDCSAQRRHQKVIEEAPAAAISESARKVVLESAVALARYVGYTNAGTVEFLVCDDEVFFLEMNTRLQVEHPVTEMAVSACGAPLDLVRLQLDIAAGESLPFQQHEIACRGHAFEARVYAEDAFNGFLPQAGTASHVSWPSRARVDAAIETGSFVGTSYDPMLGKIIVHGPTREAARHALIAAIDETAILGLVTNLGFLRGLAASAEFRDGDVDTAWLDAHRDAIAPPAPDTAALFAAWAVATGGDPDGSPFGAMDGWRAAGPAAGVTVVLDGQAHQVEPAAGVVNAHSVRAVPAEAGALRLEVDGIVHQAFVLVGNRRVDVAHRGHAFAFERGDPFGPGTAPAAYDGAVLAPMPGTIIAVSVTAGQTVAVGEVLAVMEAMKMEFALRAQVSGTVAQVGAAVGDQVALGQALFAVEES